MLKGCTAIKIMHLYIFLQYDLFSEIFKMQKKINTFGAKSGRSAIAPASALYISCWECILLCWCGNLEFNWGNCRRRLRQFYFCSLCIPVFSLSTTEVPPFLPVLSLSTNEVPPFLPVLSLSTNEVHPFLPVLSLSTTEVPPVPTCAVPAYH